MPPSPLSRYRWLCNSFVTVMFLGAAISYYITPETCDIRGHSRKLEDLAKGKVHRKEMEREEREAAEPRRKHNWRGRKIPSADARQAASFVRSKLGYPIPWRWLAHLELVSWSTCSFPVFVLVLETGICASALCCVVRHQILTVDEVLAVDDRCCRSFA